MARYPYKVLPAPQGYSSLAEPAALPLSRCQVLKGFYPSRDGRLRPVRTLNKLLQISDNSQIAGMVLYDRTDEIPRILFSNADGWYSSVLSTPVAYAEETSEVRMSAGTPGLANVLSGSGMGSISGWQAQRQEEVFFSSNSGQVWRYYISNYAQYLRIAGLYAMDAPILAQTTGGSLTLTSTYTYYTVWVDEKGRESSPSGTTSVLLTTTNNQIVVTRGSGSWGGLDGGVYWRVYRKNPAGAIYYRVSGDLEPFANPTFTDTMSDTTAQGQAVGPAIGQNDPPPLASIGTMWKGRLVLNDLNNTFRIKISNYNAPTQFSSLTNYQNPTDGAAFIVSDLSGDDVTGLEDMGSVLGIWTRYGFYAIYGDGPHNWRLQPVHNIGCVSPDSLARHGSTAIWLGIDGIYMQEGISAPTRISLEIENDFFALRTQNTNPAYGMVAGSRKERLAEEGLPTQGHGWFFDGRYYISLGGRTFCYDTVNGGGWSDTGWGHVQSAAIVSSIYLSGLQYCFLLYGDPEDGVYSGICRKVYYCAAGSDTERPVLEDSVRIEPSPEIVSRPYPDGSRHGERRARRLIVFGEYRGDLPAWTEIGTLTLVCDGYTESYPLWVPDEDMLEKGVLCEQDFSSAATGHLIYTKLSFSVPEVEVTEHRLEFTPIN